MCGITGYFQYSGTNKGGQEVLTRMNRSLTHRGPDDEGYYLDGGLGLAMRRLKIIDLEGGHQPMCNETEDVWTVFNGEIYNFKALRAELESKGHRFQSQTDTEVIVHLYEEEGESFVKRLRGMFAIALWDKRERKLLVYRDRVGIKPLHYWFQQGTFVFGSEIKAVLQYPSISRDVSPQAVSDYIGLLYIPAPRTIYRDIHKLRPGYFLRLQEGELSEHAYWDFPQEKNNDLTEGEWVERLRAKLDETIGLHMMSDVPLGAFLSGGVDSSTMVAWMSRQSKQPLKTYAIGFDDSRFNELPFAEEVARHYGTEHHQQVLHADALELLPTVIGGFDEPFGDSSCIPTYLVSQFARRDVTVAISGDGGDELFGGYLWARKELWLEKYRQFPKVMRLAVEKALLKKGYRPERSTSFADAFRRFAFDASLSPARSFARRASCYQPRMKTELFEPWVLEEIREDNEGCLLEALFLERKNTELIDKLLYMDSKVYLPDDLLTKVDRMSMLHSLEVRVPFLDHELIELACRIPGHLKLRARTTKYILKQAMRQDLPEGTLKQRKQGFSIPLQRWFREDLYAVTKNMLLETNSDGPRYFRKEYITWLLEEHRSGRQQFGAQLFALLAFETWRRLGTESASKISLKELV